MGVDHRTLERMRDLYLFGLNMRRLSRHPFAVCSCIMGGYREDRIRLFFKVESHRIRGNKHKILEILLEKRKNHFIVRVAEYWKRG